MSLARWFGARRSRGAAAAVYERIVDQARQPAFYLQFAVPDSLQGRFEMLALHLSLVLQRLGRERRHAGCAALAQALIDHGVADWDANLRELGAGDLGVGRRVKNMAAAFYGRLAAYEPGLDSDVATLEAALRRHLYGTGAAESGEVAAMAAYVERCRDALAKQAAADLASGKIGFPEPHFLPDAAAVKH